MAAPSSVPDSAGATVPALESAMSRRRFVATVGSAVAGTSLLSLAAACRSDGTSPSPPVDSAPVQGTVVNAQNAPQAIGRIYLLQKSGLNTGRYVDVDSRGGFSFGNVAVDEYQLRYWAGSQYHVPEPNPNPIRVTVAKGLPVSARFVIEPASPGENVREIYAGDDFFQEQPFGDPNAAVVVKLGTTVCWYNVGVHNHTVTGGPWGDSGTIPEADEFMWVADRLGTIGYRCRFHDPQMQSTLQVIP